MKKFEKVPKLLKGIPQWVNWKAELRGGEDKPTKVPYDPKAQGMVKAKSNDPSTWGSFKKARKGIKKRGFDGIGFVVAKENEIIGIDLDHCVDAKTCKIEPWAREIVKAINSYTERSPSKTGLRIMVLGTLPVGGRKKGNFELYCSGHYLTITGNHLDGTPLTMKKRQGEIDKVYKQYFEAQVETTGKAKERSHQKGRMDKDDGAIDESDEVIEQAMKSKNGDKFRKLWEGDHSGYPSRSEADIALCSMLAFWFQKNHVEIDKQFRRSKMFRQKWDNRHSGDGRTYGAITISKAIAGTKTTYSAKNYRAEKPKLLELAEEMELFQSTFKEPFARFEVNGHFENWPMKSERVKLWLYNAYYKKYGTTPSKTEYDSALSVLKGIALFDSCSYELYHRIAEHDGKVFIDLGNEDWEVIEITAKGWKVTSQDVVRFRRSAGMQALAPPKPKGDMAEIKKLINFPNSSSFRLAVAWLIGSCSPKGPYPILIILGPHGSAKSTMGKFLKSLIDPSIAPLRSLQNDERNLVISANNSWVLAYDNLSHLNQTLSDALCRLSTGGGFSTRELYTDSDEVIFDVKRPLILTSISMAVGFHDLVDRSIILNLEPIEKGNRIPEQKLEKRFKKLQPVILGALCDAISCALKKLPETKIKDYPRMADFARWVAAAEGSLPWEKGKFISAYRKNRDEAVETSLEADTVAQAIMDWMKDIARKKWKGTAAELLAVLEGDPQRQDSGYVSERTIRSWAWPKSPSALSNRLKRCSPFLKKVGVLIIFGPRTGNKRIITVKKIS